MLKTRLILIASMVILVVIMYQLPKIVVDTSENEVSSSPQPSENVESDDVVHSSIISSEDADLLIGLTQKLNDDDLPEKKVIFADSLAETYFALSKFDSAAKYFDILVSLDSTADNVERSGDAYYEAFTYSVDQQSALKNGEYARARYEYLLDQNPERLDLKNKIAMTYVSSQNPMIGIQMLNQILEEDENNAEALFNLGILAVQTGQYERAIQRFEKLKVADPGNVQGRFYLGLSYKETGRKEDAIAELNEVKDMSSDEELNAIVDSLLEELN